ncbi:MAG: DoxX family protein, partial [Vicinamibacterales bacterium]
RSSDLEAGAGLLLALGLFTPLAAAVIGSVMFVAAMAVHVKQGFFSTSGGFEYNLVLGLASLSLAFIGPGAISLDALFGWATQGLAWGLAALVVGLVAGAIQLAQRSVAQPRQVVRAA